jgi:nitrogen fixation protein NifX
MSSRRLQLVWSIKQEPLAVIKVAFASTDRTRVNQHFGAAEGFVIYEVTPEKATLVGVAEFAEEAMDGNEDKLTAKVDFLEGCAAVYVMAIGASAIKKLMAKGIQPIRVNEIDAVDELLSEISRAMSEGGVAWIDRAVAVQNKQSPGIVSPPWKKRGGKDELVDQQDLDGRTSRHRAAGKRWHGHRRNGNQRLFFLRSRQQLRHRQDGSRSAGHFADAAGQRRYQGGRSGQHCAAGKQADLSALLGYLFPAIAMLIGAWLGAAFNGSDQATALGAVLGFIGALAIARLVIGLMPGLMPVPQLIPLSSQTQVSQQEFHHEH